MILKKLGLLSTIHSIAIRKKNNSTEFNVNDQTITDENHIAEKFNNYFINIGNKLAEKLWPPKTLINI